MPETMTVLSVFICNSERAFFKVLNMVKSPQPGHHVGCSLVLNSATVTIAQHLRSLVKNLRFLSMLRNAGHFRHFCGNAFQRINYFKRKKGPAVVFQD